jgi:hypothetical protein
MPAATTESGANCTAATSRPGVAIFRATTNLTTKIFYISPLELPGLADVADVQITSRSTRYIVLFNCVLSFFFNTAILAMSVNIIAGLS